MLINCFRGSNTANRHSLSDDNNSPSTTPRRPRPIPSTSALPTRAKTFSSRGLHRNGSAGSSASSSTASWCSNTSIAQLPPCKRDSDSDSRIEAMMMPVPSGAQRPSRCLRLSHPKTYSALVADMKACKGTRDWRNFAVFYADEIDENVSAVERAKARARDCERKIRAYEAAAAAAAAASTSASASASFDEVDMIG